MNGKKLQKAKRELAQLLCDILAPILGRITFSVPEDGTIFIHFYEDFWKKRTTTLEELITKFLDEAGLDNDFFVRFSSRTPITYKKAKQIRELFEKLLKE